jgi:hypothetical protein
MPMNRKQFLKIAALAAGAAVVGGGALYMTREGDLLDDHRESTEHVLVARLGHDQANGLMADIRTRYQDLASQIPYIGGEENMFSEWLAYGAYYLAVYRALQGQGYAVEQAGRIIYDVFTDMADHPRWLLRIVGRLKYNRAYVDRLRTAAAETQERRYAGDWVATFVEGDGVEFDYGLDITECGISKFYHAQGADELASYMCLSDHVVSQAFNRGLVRHKTLAEGAEVCDFRYKQGRETYVYPLRDGWPPQFMEPSANLIDEE